MEMQRFREKGEQVKVLRQQVIDYKNRITYTRYGEAVMALQEFHNKKEQYFKAINEFHLMALRLVDQINYRKFQGVITKLKGEF